MKESALCCSRTKWGMKAVCYRGGWGYKHIKRCSFCPLEIYFTSPAHLTDGRLAVFLICCCVRAPIMSWFETDVSEQNRGPLVETLLHGCECFQFGWFHHVMAVNPTCFRGTTCTFGSSDSCSCDQNVRLILSDGWMQRTSFSRLLFDCMW